MTSSLLLSWLIAILAGFFLVGIFWPVIRPVSSLFFMGLFLSAGVGIGICSCFFFLWLLIFRRSEYWLLEVGVLVCLVALYFGRKKEHFVGGSEDLPPEPLGSLRLRQMLAFSLYGAVGCSLIAFILLYLAGPYGAFDAWSIWNLRARFLFRAGEGWRHAFSALLGWSHPDYPLLLPCSVARIWQYAGTETQIGPALISSLFTFATIGLIVSSISGLRGRIQGYLAGLVMVSTYYFVQDGVSQCADVLLDFYFLATVVLLSYQSRFSDNRNFAILAGTAAGLSAWTKNEGLLFLVAVTVAQLAAAVSARNWKVHSQQILSFFVGLLPVLMIIIYFKVTLAHPNDLISSLEWKSVRGRVLDFPRYPLIAGAFLHEMSGFPVLVLAIGLICLGITANKQQRSYGTPLLWALGVMLLGYFFVYVTTYQNLSWHLRTSLRRILVPLWPSAVFTYFLFVRTPKEAGPLLLPRFLKKILQKS